MSDQHPSWMPPPGYGPGGYGYPQPQDTNGFAIAALVCALVGIVLMLIGPLLGVIFGSIALKQIPRLGQSGRGLAIAGITIGAVILLLDVVVLIAMAVDPSSGSPGGINV